jgi:polysaccharide pyruvyl transferase WcaK-like protein
MPVVATLGAAYSANKGAAAMMQALLDNLPARLGPTRFVAVSTHPAGDRRSYEQVGADVTVVAQPPATLALVHFPIALLAGLLRVLHLPWRWVCRPAALKAMARADVVADISGICFVDGRRPIVLVYNALVDAVPLLLGRPVVKCAQAMGPFRNPLNRRLARLVLPRLTTVCPRGAQTEQHVRDLGLTNLMPASDVAFTMRVPDDVREQMRKRLADNGPGPYLVVSPSQIVDTSCKAKGIEYQTIMSDYIDAAVEAGGHTVVLVAHSAQIGAGVTHMNDLPLCRSIHQRLRHRDQVVFFDEDLLPTQLRAIISEAALCVTSRFHAMIAALAEQTPPLVIGWSHKYGEVLDPFGLGEVAMTYDDLTTGSAIFERSRELLEQSDDIRARIAKGLPQATTQAEVNFDALEGAVLGRHPEAAKDSVS